MNERMSGQGKVFKGQQFIADVSYDVRTRSHYKTSRTMTSEGRYFAGQNVQITIGPPSAISRHFGLDKFTLHMSDGRKQDFYIETPAGDCRATGGPY